MKKRVAFTILFGSGISACAPVASSVQKIPANTSFNQNSVTRGSEKFDLGVVPNVKVVELDAYESFKKELASDYKLAEFAESDQKMNELRESGGLAQLDLGSSLNRADLLLVFVLRPHVLKNLDQLSRDLKIAWLRSESNHFTFEVSMNGASGRAWASIKENLVSTTLASREAPTQ